MLEKKKEKRLSHHLYKYFNTFEQMNAQIFQLQIYSHARGSQKNNNDFVIFFNTFRALGT